MLGGWTLCHSVPKSSAPLKVYLQQERGDVAFSLLEWHASQIHLQQICSLCFVSAALFQQQ